MRYSKQRELVLQKVEQLCDHPTAEEIFDLAARECPGLSLGTVYRNLNSLVEAGRTGPIPRQLQNKHFDGEDAAVKGQNYKYAHDFENHWVEQQYLPDVLKDVKYYTFGDNRTEQAARAYWAKIKGEDKL